MPDLGGAEGALVMGNFFGDLLDGTCLGAACVVTCTGRKMIQAILEAQVSTAKRIFRDFSTH